MLGKKDLDCEPDPIELQESVKQVLSHIDDIKKVNTSLLKANFTKLKGLVHAVITAKNKVGETEKRISALQKVKEAVEKDVDILDKGYLKLKADIKKAREDANKKASEKTKEAGDAHAKAKEGYAKEMGEMHELLADTRGKVNKEISDIMDKKKAAEDLLREVKAEQRKLQAKLG